ncbi:photosystem II reaction center X protein [Synechococcus sp. PCC 7336]|nr:photosystem II reaction center X protein [Synechococcus sp. PCC 7336]
MTPSLINFLLSLVYGGVVLGLIFGGIVFLGYLDKVKRS